MIIPCVPGIVTLIRKNIEPIIYGCFFILSEPLNSPKYKARADLQKLLMKCRYNIDSLWGLTRKNIVLNPFAAYASKANQSTNFFPKLHNPSYAKQGLRSSHLRLKFLRINTWTWCYEWFWMIVQKLTQTFIACMAKLRPAAARRFIFIKSPIF